MASRVHHRLHAEGLPRNPSSDPTLKSYDLRGDKGYVHSA